VLDKLPKIETHQHDPIEAAEQIISGMPNPPEIPYAGSKAFYSPITDRITLPPRELFTSTEEIYASLFHELAHSSGSAKRLDRKSISEAAPCGSPVYSFEELIAECSAAYLCAEAGISPAVLENQAAYIQAGWRSCAATSGWLQLLPLRLNGRPTIFSTCVEEHDAAKS
jgi:antirestriction protein ArdC